MYYIINIINILFVILNSPSVMLNQIIIHNWYKLAILIIRFVILQAKNQHIFCKFVPIPAGIFFEKIIHLIYL
jgi:hypothetical protein